MDVESLFHMHLIHAHKFMVKLFIFNAHYCHGHERSWMVTSSQSDIRFVPWHKAWKMAMGDTFQHEESTATSLHLQHLLDFFYLIEFFWGGMTEY